MKKKIALVLLITILLISCGKNSGDQVALDEFEVLDINIDGLSESEASRKAGAYISEKYPRDDYEFIEENKISKVIDIDVDPIKSIAGFRITDQEIIILDQEAKDIKILNLQGQVLKTIASEDMGSAYFSDPSAFYFDEEEGLYYILDNGEIFDKKIIRADENFNFVDEIKLQIFEEKASGRSFDSIVHYKDKIYISTHSASESVMAIISIDKDGKEKMYDQRFGGFLKVTDGKLYAVQTLKGFKYGKKIKSAYKNSREYETYGQCGDAIYLLEEDKMQKLYDLPSHSSFTDLVKKGDSYYLSSGSTSYLHEFKSSTTGLEYTRSLTDFLGIPNKNIDKRFLMQDYEGGLALCDSEMKKIYIIDLTE